jgi:hypothetical protein
MEDVLPLPEYKVFLPKGWFNSICASYIICMDPDLGMGWAALRRVACRCGPCKDQLMSPWAPWGYITM